ncbi:hypothetical protein PENTCL1PPCAC_16728, partial [Pristionchus entomophagus]
SERMSFEAACQKVKSLNSLSNDELLELYALYKQALMGDNGIPKPGMTDLKGQAKWNAWDSKKGLSKDDAKNEYAALVEKLEQKYK